MKNDKANRIIEKALKQGRKTLSEYEAKQVLSAYDIPITKEVLAKDKIGRASCRERVSSPV